MHTYVKRLLCIGLMLFGGVLQASCPSNYTTTSVTATDGLGNIILYEVCYPTVVSMSVNGGDFNIYMTMTNTGSTTSEGITFDSFLPDHAALFTLVSSGCPPSLAGSTACDGTNTGGGGGGMGTIVYNSGIAMGATTKLTATMKAIAVGSYSYQPVGIAQPLGTARFPNITITVENTCPTITASSFTGCEAGNLATGVTGGASPYNFFATGTQSGGLVFLASNGAYVFSSPAGSFQYQASDVAGCLSNVATVKVDNPTAGAPVLVTTTSLTVTTPLNVSGGTPPYTYTTEGGSNLTNIMYDTPSTGQVTATQAFYGPSLLTYSVTDANGCVIDENANIYVYSCDPGYTASAALVDNVIYAICAPSTVVLGNEFSITVTIANPSTTLTTSTFEFADIIPSGLVVPDLLCPGTPGLSYQSNTPPPAGTTFTTSGSELDEGGMGNFNVTAGSIPPATIYSVTISVLATAVGPQCYKVDVLGNPAQTFKVNINVVNCPAITGASTGITGCSDFVTGNLSGLVSGGSGPYVFTQSGALSCSGSVTLNSDGTFSYTAPVGYSGPCSFDYIATDTNGCTSSEGVVTITANLGPTAIPSLLIICENQSFIGGILGVSGGTPAYTFAIVTNGTKGTATITNPATGTFNYVPNPGATGADSFTFQVTDSTGCVSNVATVTVTINPNPTTFPVSLTACINGSLTGDLNNYATGANPPFTFGPTGATVGGAVSINPTGPFSFTASAGFSGPGGFQYQVTDTNGCFGTGAVNISFTSPIAGNTAINDCVNQAITGSLAGLVSGGIPPYTFTQTGTIPCGNVSINIETGQFTFTPNAGFSGSCPFVYQVTDTNGCFGTGLVNVTISSPVAGNTSVNDCVNQPISGSLVPLVSSGFPPYTFSPTGAAVGGVATVSATGGYTFTPNAGFSGPGSFQYQVTDSNSCVGTGQVSVTISAPIAGNTAVNDCVNQSVTGNLAPLVSSGFPPYTFSATGTAVGGIPSVSGNGLYTFTPTAGFSGAGSFNYQVVDSVGCVATGNVAVTVSAPIAGNTGLNLCTNGSIQGSLASLVTSGFPPYVFGLTGAPTGGSASVSSTGLFGFTASPGFTGTGGFVYQVTDTNSCVGTGAVNISINGPVAQDLTGTTCHTTLTGNLANLVSGGSGPYTFSGPIGTISCPGGLASINPSGIYSFTAPSSTFTGTCAFTYEVTDSNGCNDFATVSITPNTSQVIVNPSFTACVGTTFTGTLINSVVGGVPPLTFTQVGTSTNGTAIVSASGPFAFTPVPSTFVGTGTFMYVATDSSTPPCVSDTGTASIQFVNCCPVPLPGTFYYNYLQLIPAAT